MKWLNYHHLYYFRTIAIEGGIAKASKVLRLGQPTLSTQLKQLEDSLGHPLFDRKNRSLVLTEAGKIALEYADSIFRTGSELIQVLEDQTFSERIDVKIGALDSIPKTLIVDLFRAAQKDNECTISLLEGRGNELFREMFNHQIDLILSNHTPISSELGKTYIRTIAKVPISVFGAPKFFHLKKSFPHSMAGQPFILPTIHSKLRADLDHFFNRQKLFIKCVAETQDTSLQKLLAIEELGLIAVPDFAVKEVVNDKKLAKLGTLNDVSEEFFLISAARKIENPVAAKLMKTFKLNSF